MIFIEISGGKEESQSIDNGYAKKIQPKDA